MAAEEKPEPIIIIKRVKKGSNQHAYGGMWKVAYADLVTTMMAFFLLMWLMSAANEETKKGIADYFTTSIINFDNANEASKVTKPSENNSPEENEIPDEDVDINTSKVSIASKKEDLLFPKRNAKGLESSADSAIKILRDQNTQDMLGSKKDSTLSKDTKSPPSKENASEQSAKSENQGGFTAVTDQTKNSMANNQMPTNIFATDKQAVSQQQLKTNTSADQKNQESHKNNEASAMNKKDIVMQQIAQEKMNTSKNSTKKSIESQHEQTHQAEVEKFKNLMKELNHAFSEIKGLKTNLVTELTDQGIRVQIMDGTKKAMFENGSAVPLKYTQRVLQEIAQAITHLPNKIAITGHTDAHRYKHENIYSNWELSSDRANAARHILEKAGINSDRFIDVTGKAAQNPINKKNPYAPENRRITISILYSQLDKKQQKRTEQNAIKSKPEKTKTAQKPQQTSNSN